MPRNRRPLSELNKENEPLKKRDKNISVNDQAEEIKRLKQLLRKSALREEKYLLNLKKSTKSKAENDNLKEQLPQLQNENSLPKEKNPELLNSNLNFTKEVQNAIETLLQENSRLKKNLRNAEDAVQGVMNELSRSYQTIESLQNQEVNNSNNAENETLGNDAETSINELLEELEVFIDKDQEEREAHLGKNKVKSGEEHQVNSDIFEFSDGYYKEIPLDPLPIIYESDEEYQEKAYKIVTIGSTDGFYWEENGNGEINFIENPKEKKYSGDWYQDTESKTTFLQRYDKHEIPDTKVSKPKSGTLANGAEWKENDQGEITV